VSVAVVATAKEISKDNKKLDNIPVSAFKITFQFCNPNFSGSISGYCQPDAKDSNSRYAKGNKTRITIADNIKGRMLSLICVSISF
jgi:hypothetical protein